MITDTIMNYYRQVDTTRRDLCRLGTSRQLLGAQWGYAQSISNYIKCLYMP